MSLVNLPYEELQRRFEEQQFELDSLIGQRMDRDATIDFLQRKIVSIQRGAARGHEEDGGNLQALLDHREQQIRELEDHLAHARQEMQLCRGAPRGDEATQALRRQLQLQGQEVESLRASLDRCQGDMQLCRRQDAHEIAELQHQLQVRDEQVHAMGAAMEDMEKQYRSVCDHERVSEQNHCLTEALQRAKLRADELQVQLREKELEAGALAGEVRALQQELFQVRQCQDRDAGFHGSNGARSPKAGFSAAVPSSRPPLPRMPSSSDIASQSDVCRVGDIALCQGLQEREDTVLQLCRELLRLQNQIHGQLAQHGSLGREARPSSTSAREASPEADCNEDLEMAELLHHLEQLEKAPKRPAIAPAPATPMQTQKPCSGAASPKQQEAAAPKAASAAVEEAAEPLEEPVCEETAAGGGLLVSLNFFDKEDLKAKKAKQQRVVRKIEERRRFEKARADDAKAAAEAAPAPEPPQAVPSAEAGKSKVISSKGSTPRKGLSAETDAWDSYGAQPRPVAAPGDLTGNHENLQHGPSHSEPSLHDRFASIRAEMKRRRPALGATEQPLSRANPGG